MPPAADHVLHQANRYHARAAALHGGLRLQEEVQNAGGIRSEQVRRRKLLLGDREPGVREYPLNPSEGGRVPWRWVGAIRRRGHRRRTLHGGPAVAAAGQLVEQRRSRLAGDHPIGDRIGMALVFIARRADAPLELDATALLDDVGRFVRSGVQVGPTAEDDMVAGGIGIGVHGARRSGSLRACVCLDRRDVVPAEQTLDGIAVRQMR